MDDRPDRLAELRASARGWHGVQLAVLGFIGLCGVLTDPASPDPMWLQVLAATLALAALVLACAATYLVGTVAWPLYGGRDGGDLERSARRLTRGLVLTFAAVALLALAAGSSWWPEDRDGAGEEGAAARVELQAASGRSVCGELAAGDRGTVVVVADGQRIAVPVQALAGVRPC